MHTYPVPRFGHLVCHASYHTHLVSCTPVHGVCALAVSVRSNTQCSTSWSCPYVDSTPNFLCDCLAAAVPQLAGERFLPPPRVPWIVQVHTLLVIPTMELALLGTSLVPMVRPKSPAPPEADGVKSLAPASQVCWHFSLRSPALRALRAALGQQYL